MRAGACSSGTQAYANSQQQRERFGSSHLGFGFDDVDVVALVVVMEADAVALGQAREAAQRCLQHCLGVADV